MNRIPCSMSSAVFGGVLDFGHCDKCGGGLVAKSC